MYSEGLHARAQVVEYRAPAAADATVLDVLARLAEQSALLRALSARAAGELKIIAAILERTVIEKILRHLGLDQQPSADSAPAPDRSRRRQLSGTRLRYARHGPRSRCQ